MTHFVNLHFQRYANNCLYFFGPCVRKATLDIVPFRKVLGKQSFYVSGIRYCDILC
jgi:hypothetical protein